MSYAFSYKKKNFKNLSFFIYGLGSTGLSSINYLKRKKIKNYFVWDDKLKLRNKFSSKISLNLRKNLDEVDYIILSPGISLNKSKYKKILTKFKNKIITDIDLLFLSNKNFKSIVVTGTNGKSTTCKIISHLLHKNKFNVQLGGNIGTPVLNLKIKKNIFFIIEASSFQLSYSKFIHPNYAVLLNITNDHLDWHGSMRNYIDSKFKIFNLQKKNNFAFINDDFKNLYKKRKFSGKLIPVLYNKYKKIKSKIKNKYLRSSANDLNMSFVYTLSRILRISNKSFVKSMNSFVGLSHRYEIFMERKGITFINDSKATSFQASKFALSSSENIFWILGGIPKLKDKIILRNLKSKIIKTYIIGKNVNFFKKQLINNVEFVVTKSLKKAIILAIKDVKKQKRISNTILLSPGATSFDQFKNFENRGNEFKN